MNESLTSTFTLGQSETRNKGNEWVLHNTNTIGKSMNEIILPLAFGI